MKKDEQYWFTKDIGPLVKCFPGGVEVIAKQCNLNVKVVKDFLSNKIELDEFEFMKLYSTVACSYSFGERSDGQPIHVFDLNHSRTFFPVNGRQMVDAYDAVSHGGDFEAAYEIVMLSGYRCSDYRYVLMSRYGEYYLFCLPNDETLDKLTKSDKLINYDGVRNASDKLYNAIWDHSTNVANNPEQSAELDAVFFDRKDMVFSQLALSKIEEYEQDVIV